MPNSTRKTPWPIEEVECEVVEMDESKYKSLLFSVYSGLQRISDALNKADQPSEEA